MLTLDETNSLVGALGVTVPPAVLAEKARAEEFKSRREQIRVEAAGKPADWPLKKNFDDLLNRAEGLAANQQFDSAINLLAEAQQLLLRPDVPASEPEPGGSASSVQEKKGEKVLFAQARLKWEVTRKQARAEVEKFAAALRAEFQREPDFTAIEASIQKFAGLLKGLDERLLDKLDEAYNATTPEAEKALRKQAAGIVKEHQAFIAGNELLKGLDSNPILPVQVEGPLKQTLNELAGQLG